MADDSAIMVLTFKSVERLLKEGGSSSWRLNRMEALKRKYVVCTRNRFDARCEGTEAHGSAFLVGEIKDVVPAPGRDGRWLVTFDRYAPVDLPDAWAGDRNPIRYTSLSDVGIDLASLDFHMMPDREPSDKEEPVPAFTGPRPLTIAEAKIGLAMTFGVLPEAIEIVVRG